MAGVLNMRLSLGINGKCLSTFQGRLLCCASLYQGALHLGHWTAFSNDTLNNTHLDAHAWMVV